MRKVVLYIAMSLDGYIADQNGGVDWLGGQEEDPQNEGSYPSFIKDIDTIIMGWNTYNQITTQLSPTEWVYSGLTSYIVTHKKIASTDEKLFTDETPCNLVKKLAQENGKNIWICGGASIVQQLVQADLIDTYYISVIPIILGNGIRLFVPMEHGLALHFIKTQNDNGIVELIYERR